MRVLALAVALVAGCARGPGVEVPDARPFLDFAGADEGPAVDLAMPADLAMIDAPPSIDLAGGCATVEIVLNEVKTGGASGTDEFVELYNPCGGTIDLSGYRIVYRSATGTSDITIVTLAQSIGPLGYLLFTNTGFTGGGSDGMFAAGSGLAQTGGGLALRDAANSIVDSVGWGNATNAFIEGAATPAPASFQSIGRMPNGHDTDQNATNFVVYATPSPRLPN